MTRRVLISHRLPELRSGNPELDRWVSQTFDQISFLTPEDGLWTPSVRGSGTAGTYELATAAGTYYKIADIVVMNFYIVFAAAITGGGTGDLNILGSPFEKPEIASGSHNPLGSVLLSGVDTTAGTVSIAVGFSALTDSTTLVLQQTLDNAASVLIPISAVAVNDVISGTITYKAGDRTG